jgi:hypothetical protein
MQRQRDRRQKIEQSWGAVASVYYAQRREKGFWERRICTFELISNCSVHSHTYTVKDPPQHSPIPFSSFPQLPADTWSRILGRFLGLANLCFALFLPKGGGDPLWPEAKFLDEMQTKVFRVFLLAVHSLVLIDYYFFKFTQPLTVSWVSYCTL